MLKSTLLSGNPRLDQAAGGPPSIRKRPPDDDTDAVQRIQKGLAKLGHDLPKSFKFGPNADPDGLYGSETEGAVRDFQKRAFPKTMSEWDGRCGPKTLRALDELLATQTKPKGAFIPPRYEVGTCRCHRGSPADAPKPKPIVPTPPSPTPIPYPTVTLKRGLVTPASATRPRRRIR